MINSPDRNNDDRTSPGIPRLTDLVGRERAALLIVDVQQHFLGEAVAVGVPSFVANLERLIESAREAGVMRIFIRAVESEEANTDVWISRHASNPERLGNRDGTPNSAFHPRIQPRADETVITKTRYSAFLGTDLEPLLRGSGIDTVIVTGVQADVCVRFTAADAFQRDFWTITVRDCTTTRSDEDQARAMSEAGRYWGFVAQSDDIVAAWEALAGRPERYQPTWRPWAN